MKINDLLNQPGFTVLVAPENGDKEITGIKCCDLLSWVMANGGEGDAWITVQTHLNVVAVAALLDMACVIVPEGIEMEEATLEKARSQSVAVLAADTDAFGIFSRCYEAGLRK